MWRNQFQNSELLHRWLTRSMEVTTFTTQLQKKSRPVVQRRNTASYKLRQGCTWNMPGLYVTNISVFAGLMCAVWSSNELCALFNIRPLAQLQLDNWPHSTEYKNNICPLWLLILKRFWRECVERILRDIRSRGMKWVRHAARMGGMRNAYIFVEKNWKEKILG